MRGSHQRERVGDPGANSVRRRSQMVATCSQLGRTSRELVAHLFLVFSRVAEIFQHVEKKLNSMREHGFASRS